MALGDVIPITTLIDRIRARGLSTQADGPD